MKAFRGLLIGLIAVCICVLGAQTAEVVQAASPTTVYLSAQTVSAGKTYTWSQQKLTNGDVEGMYFALETAANTVDVGFKKVYFGKKFSWYSGTMTTSNLVALNTLTGATGKYKPYFTNSNSSKSINVTSSSYIVIY